MEISTINEILSYLRGRKVFLHEKFGVTHMGIFESFAQGGQTIKSDIDLRSVEKVLSESHHGRSSGSIH